MYRCCSKYVARTLRWGSLHRMDVQNCLDAGCLGRSEAILGSPIMMQRVQGMVCTSSGEPCNTYRMA